MKGITTEKDIMNAKPTKTTHWGFVKLGKKKFALAVIQNGRGYEPVVELEMLRTDVAERMFFDIYQQLKGIFEGISKHH